MTACVAATFLLAVELNVICLTGLVIVVLACVDSILLAMVLVPLVFDCIDELLAVFCCNGLVLLVLALVDGWTLCR